MRRKVPKNQAGAALKPAKMGDKAGDAMGLQGADNEALQGAGFGQHHQRQGRTAFGKKDGSATHDRDSR